MTPRQLSAPLALPVLALSLLACSPSAPPAAPSAPAAPAAKKAPEATTLAAPSGRYALDRNHASLSFSVTHLGFSNYVARFVEFDLSLDLDSEQPANSSVTVTINPRSVRTDYPGDYKATHKKSPFNTWDEDLALSPKFLHAEEHPEISYRSTRVTATGPQSFVVDGELSLRGQTRPVQLQASVVGAGQHPFSGKGAIGFSAEGQFARSAFGMTHLLDPPLVGDTVTIRFEGEFQRQEDAAPTG